MTTKTRPEPTTRADINIRSNAEFTAWVGEFADAERLSVATLIEQALVYFAGVCEFKEEAPPRRKQRSS